MNERPRASLGARRFFCLHPPASLPSSRQFAACLEELESLLRLRGLTKSRILKLTFFLKPAGDAEIEQKRSRFQSLLNQAFDGVSPAASFVAQAPEGGREVCLEATISEASSEDIHVSYKILNERSYTVVVGPAYKEVIAAGLNGQGQEESLFKLYLNAFAQLDAVLRAEGMIPADIVRQWNYIGQILNMTGPKKVQQNYQVFNDARSRYYAGYSFPNGYPAATGIGMSSHGVVLEAIALRASPEIRIIPLSNPRQHDAHRYSQNVLKGSSAETLAQKTSPKFERAKFLANQNAGFIYISGTAAVLGEESAARGDIRAQTRITIENIQELISSGNRRKSGADIGLGRAELAYLRAYVKRVVDIPTVRSMCTEAFGTVPSIFVVSDICRDELLVEIEGAAWV
jgi:enamine deaminase RidA (YjgF/YER057c/UK114 family)